MAINPNKSPLEKDLIPDNNVIKNFPFPLVN